MNRKVVLVTGHKGLLGSACCRVLGHDYEVTTMEGDLRDEVVVYNHFARHKIDYVIHCAARVGGVKSNRDNPVEFIEDNVAINSNVISACHMFGIKKLVNVGTSCMFPKDAPIPVKESSFMTGPLEPAVEAYAMAKILAYTTCNAYRFQHGKSFVTVAPCNLYGPNDSYGAASHVIPSLIQKAFKSKENGTSVEIWGDGSATREFLHSYDAAQAIKVILEKYDSPELISIGSGVSTSIKELAMTICDVVGAGDVRWVPSEPTGIQNKTFDISKIKSIGWEPKISLLDGIAQCCADFHSKTNIRLK